MEVRELPPTRRIENSRTEAGELAGDIVNDTMLAVWREAACFRADSRLSMALAELSTVHRITLELTHYGGYSCEEVAAIMDCPVNMVKTRMSDARNRLRLTLSVLASTAGSDS